MGSGYMMTKRILMNKEQLIEKLKKTSFYPWFRKTFYELKEEDYNQRIIDNSSVSKYIIDNLQNTQPFMVSRLGSIELKILKNYYKKRKYTKKLRFRIKNNAGVFPTDDYSLDKFAKLYFKSISNIDLLGVWFNPFEDVIANKFCPNAKLTKLRNLEPYFSSNPWSYYLKGKKVLVIHPFTSSIEAQYKKRDQLFQDKNILPEFKLITFQAVQSLGGNSKFETWFNALDYMQHEINKLDFDVAIIGAGAYGLPLASFIKDMGKKVIHLGGSTQMLFGVYGRRWKINPDFQHLINNDWIKPSESDKPKNAALVENACYW